MMPQANTETARLRPARSPVPNWVASTRARFRRGGRHLPGEAHPPVHLDARSRRWPGRPRRPAAWRPSPPGPPRGRGAPGGLGLGLGDSGSSARQAAACTAARATSARTSHVGTHVLDRLEAADGPAELLALLGVGRRRGRATSAAMPDLERGGEHVRRRATMRRRPASATGSPVGRRLEAPQRGERVQRRGHAGRTAGRAPAPGGAASSRGRRPAGPAARRARPGARPRIGPGPPPEHADLGPPLGRSLDHPGRRRPGGSRPAARARAPGPAPRRRPPRRPCRGPPPAGSGRQRCEHPGLAQLPPAVAGRPPARPPSAARRRSSGNRPWHSGAPVGQLGWTRSLEVQLPPKSYRADLERAPWAGRGCARRRCCAGSARCRRRWSARCPAASPPPGARPAAEADPSRPAGSSAASPARPRRARAELAQPLAGLGVGQLEHGAAEARDPGAGRLGHVAPGQRPQRVELGPQVAGLAPDARVRPGPGCARPAPPSRSSSSNGLEQVADEGGAPFEAQGDHGHPPAVVLVADPVGHRDPHLVEEQLGELGRAGDGAQRADLDARARPWAG